MTRSGFSAIVRWLVTPTIRAGSSTTTAHSLQQRLAVEHRVRIDAADVPEPRDVEPCVERVGLAAVLLVHDDEIRMRPSAIDRPHVLGRKDVPHEHLVRLQLECLDEPGERLVRGAVVHRDHLELGVFEVEERLDRRDDRGLLVVRGDDDAHGNREAGLAENVEVL